jgi:hypothetical protein
VKGVEFADAEISVSPQFKELHPGVKLPPFRWLKPTGVAGRDDFGLGSDHRLVVSKPATHDVVDAVDRHARSIVDCLYSSSSMGSIGSPCRPLRR